MDNIKELKISFTNKEITPWGGVSLLIKFLKQIRFKETLDRIDFPKPGSNRGYKVDEVIISFMAGIWCGANKFLHTDSVRRDIVISKLLNYKRVASSLTIERFFKKFTLEINKDVFGKILEEFFSKFKIITSYILDIDSSVFTRYGKQEGAVKGYNPNKRGRPSHNPSIAFVPEYKMVVNFKLRAGNAVSSTDFIEFFEESVERLKGKTLKLFRGDSGYFSDEILTYFEERSTPVKYIISAKLYTNIKRKLFRLGNWQRVTDGIEVSEITIQLKNWKKARRFIIIRQDEKKRKKATGKKLLLFDEAEYIDNYRYACLVTNDDMSAYEIWENYKQRANAENIIKELKYDFGADSFNLKEFNATEAALNVVMITFNIMSLFNQIIMKTNVFHRMSSLRNLVLAIGGYIVEKGNEKFLYLSLHFQKRKSFLALWNRIDDVNIMANFSP